MTENFRNYIHKNASISSSGLAELESLVSVKEAKKGSFLLREGSICTQSFFVEEGLLRLYSIDQHGKEHILQLAPENWIITDRESTFFNAPSKYFIDAVEDSKLVLIDHHFISKLSAIDTEFMENNNRALHNHIRHLYQRINLLIGANAETRYLEFIELYPKLVLRTPQWMIASYLGITPESLSRVRKNLAEKNFKGY